MIPDNSSDRLALNSYEVSSVYFSHNLVMDESSSKIKKEEPNTSKNSQTKSGKVQKRPRKKEKGQKDIRTLIKSKKNELVTYSKDFDSVCKQLGVDVDPEQLQLAIALSKSLQDSDPGYNNSGKENALTSNQRKGKIRTTLQEYGFKVPELKNIKGKRGKKYRKQYRLLLASDSEKRERIADKYAQILFKNVSCIDKSLNTCETNSHLYYLSTCVPYKQIKDDEVFYINDLVEKSLPDTHHMLKDWSEIPGRPKSPVCELPDICFKSIHCSDEELISILSGAIETAQHIVKKCYETYLDNRINLEETASHTKDINHSSLDIEIENKVTNELSENSTKSQLSNKYCNNTVTMTPPTNRSCSPDIFDDEVTIIMDTSKDRINVQENLTVEISERTKVREPNDFMDLTECVDIHCNTSNFKQKSSLSQGSNKTRIDPNDFMEMTGCVTACSQKINDNLNKTNHYEKENSNPNVCKVNEPLETMDLTQTPIVNERLQNNGNRSLDDTIIMVEDYYCNINTGCNVENKTRESSVIIDLVEEPEVSEHSTDILTSKEKGSSPKSVQSSNRNEESPKLTMDLTQSSNSEDSLSPDLIRECPIVPSHTTSISDEAEKSNIAEDITENPINSPEDMHFYDDADVYREISPVLSPKSPSSPISMCYDDNRYGYESPVHDIPSKSLDNSKTNLDISTVNDAMDLTQSSNSEGSLNISQEIKDGRNSNTENSKLNNLSKETENQQVLNDDSVIIVNEYVDTKNSDSDSNMPHIILPLNEPEKKKGNQILENTFSPNRSHDTSKVTLTQCLKIIRNDQSTGNLDSDREFDDVIENISKSKQSKSQTYDTNITNSKDVIHENDLDTQSREIDLTQHSDSSENTICMEIPNDLGKKDNISIDYDEVNTYSHNEINYDEIYDVPTNDYVEKERDSINEAASSSHNSAAFQISDNEFNYSINQQKEDNSIRLDRTQFDIGGISTIDGFLNRNSLSKSKLRCSCSNSELYSDAKDHCIPEVQVKNYVNLDGPDNRKSKSCTEIEAIKVSSPSKSRSEDHVLFAQTPKHSDYIIKTDVTPMPNYEIMTSPQRNEELDKFGIKPLKRKRAIQILTHIYNQTHPVMEVLSGSEEYSSPAKKRKTNDDISIPKRALSSQIDLVSNNYIEPGPSLEPSETISKKSSKSRNTPINKSPINSPIQNTDNLYEETRQCPDIRNLVCCPEDWIFQKREKAKIHSCRVPLHIAFHNYVSCRQALREAILRYEPINIDDIHKGLVAIGYRYNPKDLLKFMDKKCITVKTADNVKNNKK